MHGRHWMHGRFLIGIASVLLLAVLMTGCGRTSSWYSETSLDRIADNYKEFFSVKYDRSDITRGEFKLFPWFGDRVSITSDALPAVTEKPVKKESEDGRTIKVQPVYQFANAFLTPIVTRNVSIKWGEKGEEIPVPVTLQIVSKVMKIDEGSGKRVQSLSTGNHVYRVKVDDTDIRDAIPNGDHTYFRNVKSLLDLPYLELRNTQIPHNGAQ